MDSCIRQGNIRNTPPNSTASNNGKEYEVEGTLQARQTLGFRNTADLMIFTEDIGRQLDREIGDWAAY
jgi:hypothetical protein